MEINDLFNEFFGELPVSRNNWGDRVCSCCNGVIHCDIETVSLDSKLDLGLNLKFAYSTSSICHHCVFHLCLLTNFSKPDEYAPFSTECFVKAYTISMGNELGEFLNERELNCEEIKFYETFEELERRNELLSLYSHVFNNVYDIYYEGERLWRLNKKHWHEITNWKGTRFHDFYLNKSGGVSYDF